MTRVHVDQLDAATRKRLGLPAGKGRSRAKPSRADGAGQPCPGTCAGALGCGAPWPTYSRWEKHKDLTGCGGRWSIDIIEGAT